MALSRSVINSDTSKHPQRPFPDFKIPKRFSRPFSFTRRSEEHKHGEHKPTPLVVNQREKKARLSSALSKHSIKSTSKSDKRAKGSALVVRSLMVGPSATPSPQPSIANARRLEKVNGQLIKPKSANKVIAQLRALPLSDAVMEGKEGDRDPRIGSKGGPIHAVCLDHTEAEQDKLHFASLGQDYQSKKSGVSSIPIDKLSAMFQEMKVVDLLQTPDFGLGQPVTGNGILAGALPTADTVLGGITQITPQLMDLGYAVGKAIYADHKGVYPPTDRMSILTYWWGLELVLPPPTLEYLSEAQSIASTSINFLSALALVNNGVREVLPFVRYIAQFMDFEFDAIKRQNKGRGVVCAATWIMPAAMVPRPWDFPERPQPDGQHPTQSTRVPSSPSPTSDPYLKDNPQVFADSSSLQTTVAYVK